MSLPYVGYSNDTLDRQPPAKPGALIRCARCKRRHRIRAADDGSEVLMFYQCGRITYLAAVAGRLITGAEPDVKGRVPVEDVV